MIDVSMTNNQNKMMKSFLIIVSNFKHPINVFFHSLMIHDLLHYIENRNKERQISS